MFVRKIVFKIAVKLKATDKTLNLISPSLYGIHVSKGISEAFARGFITHKGTYSNIDGVETWDIKLKD